MKGHASVLKNDLADHAVDGSVAEVVQGVPKTTNGDVLPRSIVSDDRIIHCRSMQPTAGVFSRNQWPHTEGTEDGVRTCQADGRHQTGEGKRDTADWGVQGEHAHHTIRSNVSLDLESTMLVPPFLCDEPAVGVTRDDDPACGPRVVDGGDLLIH